MASHTSEHISTLSAEMKPPWSLLGFRPRVLLNGPTYLLPTSHSGRLVVTLVAVAVVPVRVEVLVVSVLTVAEVAVTVRVVLVAVVVEVAVPEVAVPEVVVVEMVVVEVVVMEVVVVVVFVTDVAVAVVEVPVAEVVVSVAVVVVIVSDVRDVVIVVLVSVVTVVAVAEVAVAEVAVAEVDDTVVVVVGGAHVPQSTGHRAVTVAPTNGWVHRTLAAGHSAGSSPAHVGFDSVGVVSARWHDSHKAGHSARRLPSEEHAR